LTKGERCDIIMKLSARGQKSRQAGEEKFFKKLLQNPLTRAKRCDIIIKSPTKGDSKNENLEKSLEKL